LAVFVFQHLKVFQSWRKGQLKEGEWACVFACSDCSCKVRRFIYQKFFKVGEKAN
jgi:hypothetical protein